MVDEGDDFGDKDDGDDGNSCNIVARVRVSTNPVQAPIPSE